MAVWFWMQRTARYVHLVKHRVEPVQPTYLIPIFEILAQSFGTAVRSYAADNEGLGDRREGTTVS